MESIPSEAVRIPRHARDAVARHEEVVVLNRDRPVFVIVHPGDRRREADQRRGRPLRDALAMLGHASPPDADFARDMESVLNEVGPTPIDPWASS